MDYTINESLDIKVIDPLFSADIISVSLVPLIEHSSKRRMLFNTRVFPVIAENAYRMNKREIRSFIVINKSNNNIVPLME